MKTTWPTLNTPAPRFGMIFLFTPALCLVAFAEQPLPEKLATTLTLVTSPVAQTDQEVTPTSCEGEDACCGSNRCYHDRCELVCSPKRVEKEVEKHCWLVEPKNVCIPGFRWPWERYRGKTPDCGDGCDGCDSCCTPVCGKVRCVNTLEKHKTTCEKCGYEWEVQCVRSSKPCRKCRKCD